MGSGARRADFQTWGGLILRGVFAGIGVAQDDLPAAPCQAHFLAVERSRSSPDLLSSVWRVRSSDGYFSSGFLTEGTSCRLFTPRREGIIGCSRRVI